MRVAVLCQQRYRELVKLTVTLQEHRVWPEGEPPLRSDFSEVQLGGYVLRDFSMLKKETQSTCH